MPTIINPYANQKTMGDDLFGLGGIADAFFGPKASQSALMREKFKEQQRQNLGVEDLAALMRNPNAAPGDMASAAVRGGVDYRNLGGINLFGVAGRNPDPLSPQVLTAQTQAQVPFGQTATGDLAHRQSAQTIAEMQAKKAADTQMAIADRTVIPTVGPDGKLVYSRTVDAPGRGAPISYDQARGGALASNWSNLGRLDPFQQNVVNADIPARNWFAPPMAPGQQPRQGRVRADGLDEATGQPLPPNAVTSTASNPGGSNAFINPNQPGTSTIGKIHEGLIAGQTAIDLGTDILSILDKDPTVGGFTGQAQRLGQNVVDVMGGIKTMMGGGRLEANIAAAQSELASVPGAAAVLPELFNPDLNNVTTLYGFMAFKVAKSFNQGGPVTKADLEAAKATMGDPTSWTAGPQGVRTSMAKTVELLQRQQDRNAQLLQTMNVPGVTATQPRPTAAPVDPARASAVEDALRRNLNPASP